jgi:hypothetical protein
MRRGTDPRGYTILEVMIFLAVSGVMFLIAATFISDKQTKSEFKLSMDDINTQVQQVINDVGNGYFPSNNNFTCTASNIAGAPPTFAPGANPGGQGANRGCVFLGKVIQFRVNGTNQAGYNIYTVAGRQYRTSSGEGTLATSFSEAQPRAVYDTSSSPPAFNLTEVRNLKWGVRVTSIVNGATPINGIGFLNSFGKYGANTSLESGSQSILVVIVPGTQPTGNETQAQMVADIATGVSDANITPRPNILICFDGGSGQFGTLRIGGGDGQRITTRTQISNEVPAGC